MWDNIFYRRSSRRSVDWKLSSRLLQENRFLVAPRVGAWIENYLFNLRITAYKVAPRVGAWIEKYNALAKSINKPVAPRVGAWIEKGVDVEKK
mgnify:CR=1 FL=1